MDARGEEGSRVPSAEGFLVLRSGERKNSFTKAPKKRSLVLVCEGSQEECYHVVNYSSVRFIDGVFASSHQAPGTSSCPDTKYREHRYLPT